MNIKIVPDELSSMAISYHILCLSTNSDKHYNSHLFEHFSISEEEKNLYQKYILIPTKKKLGLNDEKLYKLELLDTLQNITKLDDLLINLEPEQKQQLNHSLDLFYAKFIPYFNSLKQQIQPKIDLRTRQTKQMIDSVYSIAENLTGIQIEHPEKLEIKIIDGLRPSASGSNIVNGKAMIFMHPKSLDDWYWMTLIHETIAHQTSAAADKFQIHKELFGRNFYEGDEGFAYAITDKVANKLNINLSYNNPKRQDATMDSYRIFLKNWDNLIITPAGTNFSSWYRSNLLEFKKIHPAVIQR